MKKIRIFLSCCTALCCVISDDTYAQDLPAVEIHMDVISKFKSGAFSHPDPTVPKKAKPAAPAPKNTSAKNTVVFSPSPGSSVFFPGTPPAAPAVAEKRLEVPALKKPKDTLPSANNILNIMKGKKKAAPAPTPKRTVQKKAAPAVSSQAITRMPGESDSEYFTRKYNNIAAPVTAKAPERVVKTQAKAASASPAIKKAPAFLAEEAAKKQPSRAPKKGNIYTPENLEIKDGGWKKDVATIRKAPSILNKRGQNEGYNFVTTDKSDNAPLPWQAEKSVRSAVTNTRDTADNKGLDTVYRRPAPSPKPAPAAPAPTVSAAKKPAPPKAVKSAATPARPKPAAPSIAVKKAPAPVAPAQPRKPVQQQRNAPPLLRKPEPPKVVAQAAPAVKTPPAAPVKRNVKIADIAPPPGMESAEAPTKRLSLFEESRRRRAEEKQDPKVEAKKPQPVTQKPAAPKPAAPQPENKKDAGSIRERIKEVRNKSLATLNDTATAEPVIVSPPVTATAVAVPPTPKISAVEKERLAAAAALRAAIKRRAGGNTPLPPSDDDIKNMGDIKQPDIGSALDDELEKNFRDFPLENEDDNPLSDIASLADDMKKEAAEKISGAQQLASVSKKAANAAAKTVSSGGSSGIQFTAGEDALTSAHKKALDVFLADAKKSEEGTVFITGYATAADKSPEYISLRRVVAVRNYVMGAGFPNNRIRIKAKGDKTESDSQRDKVMLELKNDN